MTNDSPTIGLHVSSSQLHRAQLRREADRIEIVSLERITKNSDGASTIPPDVTEKTAPQQIVANRTITIASMPCLDVITRHLTLPRTDPARFNQMVAHRLEADLPIPMDQLVWQYRRGEADSSDGTTAFVLAQAARRDKVDACTGELNRLHYDIDALTTEAEALAALYRYGLKSTLSRGTDVLVLATTREWLIAVLTDGITRSVRHIATSADQIELACRQCRQTIDAEELPHPLKRLLWCASPELDNAHNKLSDQLQVPTEPVQISITKAGDEIKPGELAEFAPAIGLALAGFFERDRVIRFAGKKAEPAPSRYPRLERELSRPWHWTGIAAALLILASLIHISALSWETNRMDKLQTEYEQNKLESVAVEQKRRCMERIHAYRVDIEAIFADLCAQIPNSIMMTSVQLSRERGLVIKGTAKKPEEIFKLAEHMQKSSRFENVQPGRTEPGRDNTFTITADVTGITKLSSLSKRGGRWR